MGADYSFYVKTIETHAPAFLTLNILAVGRVTGLSNTSWTKVNDHSCYSGNVFEKKMSCYKECWKQNKNTIKTGVLCLTQK
jgi:hypothetical protein